MAAKEKVEPMAVMLAGDVFLHVANMQKSLRGGQGFDNPRWVAAWADLQIKSRRVAEEAHKQGWSKAFEVACDNDWEDDEWGDDE